MPPKKMVDSNYVNPDELPLSFKNWVIMMLGKNELKQKAGGYINLSQHIFKLSSPEETENIKRMKEVLGL